MVHVDRDSGGRRRLTEIALLRRDAAGYCFTVPAWRADGGPAEAAADLKKLIGQRCAP